jgi:predicted nucleic acid-binding Zn ribbon protein
MGRPENRRAVNGLDPALRQIITGFRNSKTWDEDLDLRLLQALWPRIAGPALARNTRPVGISEGRLVVQVPDAAWAAELKAIRGSLIGKVNRLWPGPAIRKIWFTDEDHAR